MFAHRHTLDDGVTLISLPHTSDDDITLITLSHTSDDDIALITLPQTSDDELKDKVPPLLPQGLDSAENEIIDEKAEPPLRYLSIFDENELKQLEIAHSNVSRFDMDKKIEENYYYFQMTKIENQIGLLAASILIPYYRFITGSHGIQAFFSKLFNITISTQIAHRISIPFVLSSGVCTSMLYSPTKNALRDTIDYALRPPCFRRIQNACSHPSTLFYNINHQMILNSTNSIAGMSLILFIWDDINSLPQPINWLLMVSTVYFNKIFFNNYCDSSYFEGLKLLGDKKYPWVLKEILHGNIALPMHVILQSASSIFLRTYPVFYFVVSKIAEKLQLPEELQPSFISFVLTMVTLQSIVMFYSSAIRTYFDPRIKLDDICENAAARKELENSILTKMNAIHLFQNEPIVLISLLYLIFSGVILGCEALSNPLTSLFHESLTANILAGTFGGAVLGSFYYRAERNHFKHILMLKESQKEEKDSERKKESCCEKISQTLSKILNVLDSIGTAISTIGTIQMGSVGFISLLTFGRMLNMMQFNGKKYTNTISSYFVKSPSVSTVPGTFFNRALPYELEIKRSSENYVSTITPPPLAYNGKR
jgi:hypothetical protein